MELRNTIIDLLGASEETAAAVGGALRRRGMRPIKKVTGGGARPRTLLIGESPHAYAEAGVLGADSLKALMPGARVVTADQFLEETGEAPAGTAALRLERPGAGDAATRTGELGAGEAGKRKWGARPREEMSFLLARVRVFFWHQKRVIAKALRNAAWRARGGEGVHPWDIPGGPTPGLLKPLKEALVRETVEAEDRKWRAGQEALEKIRAQNGK